MVFPLYIFLVLYILFVFVWVFFSLVGIYHMMKFGWKNFYTFIATFTYIAGAIFLAVVSYMAIIEIDWKINISIMDGVFNTLQFFK